MKSKAMLLVALVAVVCVLPAVAQSKPELKIDY